jgi:putative membrane protein
MLAKRIFTGLAAGIALSCACAVAQNAIPPMQTSTQAGEKAIAAYFTQDSIGDTQLGKLGLQKAKNSAVRELASAMVRDHTMSARKGLSVAQTLGDSDVQWKAGDSNQIELTRLSRYSGSQFDREYVKALIEAHKTDISTVKDSLEIASTPALKTYLHQTLSIDQKHLNMAQSAQSKL